MIKSKYNEKKLYEKGYSWSDIWITGDINRINFDDNFKSVAQYVLKNK